MKSPWRIFWVAMAFIFFLALFNNISTPASAAQAFCKERGVISERLKSIYRENLRVLGIDRHGNAIEVYVSEAGNFSILVTNTSGVSCLVLSGKDMEIVLPQLGDKT